MTKQILIDAIIGSGLGSYSYNAITYFVKQGLITYTGKWNEYWKWKREELKKLPVDLLQKIYNKEIEIPVVKEEGFIVSINKSLVDYWSDTLDKLIFKELTKDLKHDDTTV